jgi:hypothetical protein
MITISSIAAGDVPSVVLRTGAVIPFGAGGIRAVEQGTVAKAIAATTRPFLAPKMNATHTRQVVGATPSATVNNLKDAYAIGEQLSRRVDDILLGGLGDTAEATQSCPSEGTVGGLACHVARLIQAGQPVIAKAYGIALAFQPLQSYYRDAVTTANPFELGGPGIGLGAVRRRPEPVSLRHRRHAAPTPLRHRRGRPIVAPGLRRRRGAVVTPPRRPPAGGPIVPTTPSGAPLTPPRVPPAPPPIAPGGAMMPGLPTAPPSGLPPAPIAPLPTAPPPGVTCPPGFSWNGVRCVGAPGATAPAGRPIIASLIPGTLPSMPGVPGMPPGVPRPPGPPPSGFMPPPAGVSCPPGWGWNGVRCISAGPAAPPPPGSIVATPGGGAPFPIPPTAPGGMPIPGMPPFPPGFGPGGFPPGFPGSFPPGGFPPPGAGAQPPTGGGGPSGGGGDGGGGQQPQMPPQFQVQPSLLPQELVEEEALDEDEAEALDEDFAGLYDGRF